MSTMKDGNRMILESKSSNTLKIIWNNIVEYGKYRGGRLSLYKKVYEMLEDEESKSIYLNRLNWLMSGDLKYIDAIVAITTMETLPTIEKETMALRESMPKDRKIVLYGAGEVGKEIFPFWKEDERFMGFCSHTKEKQKYGYCGYPVMSPEELLSRKDLSVVISVDLKEPKNEIKQRLNESNYPAEQIFEPPTVGTCAAQNQYFSPAFMSYDKNEVLLDVGCFDLNSSLEFKKYCKSLKKIYAFEPDVQNYQVCLAKKKKHSFSEVELLLFGTWSERTTISFHERGDMSSRVCENGNANVQVLPIDEVVNPADRVTMIKMDIEGSELESLKGAKTIIQRDKPKLAICIYHKLEDMTEILLYIKELVSEYKLYIRHHSKDWCETVLYAVMP